MAVALHIAYKLLSYRSIILAASLVIGMSAILTSFLAITSARWVRVFQSRHAEAKSFNGEDRWNGSYRGSCCPEDKIAILSSGSREAGNGSTSWMDRRGLDVKEAFGGLWSVCLLHGCYYERSSTVCRQCSPANDPAFKSRPLCHVTATVLAISGEAHRTLVIYILASAILFCGVSLGVVGSFRINLFLVAGAFCSTTAGLLQLLGMFLFAVVVNEEMKTAADDLHIGYNYDWGSIHAVLAFTATNLLAVVMAYSYRGYHQTVKPEAAAIALFSALMTCSSSRGLSNRSSRRVGWYRTKA